MKPSTKDQIKGKLHEMKGEVKEKAGQVTNNPNLAAEGQNEKLAGKVQKKVGQIEKVLREVNEPGSAPCIFVRCGETVDCQSVRITASYRPKGGAMNKTLGIILIALGCSVLPGEVLRTRPGKRSLTSDRSTQLAKRHIMCRCLPSQAQWRSLAALCSW